MKNNMNKKYLLFILSAFVLVAAISNVDAALCRGFDGYYHDCGYNYGINSYGSSYGSGHGISSYGKHSGYSQYDYGYSKGHVKNTKVVYLNGYKKYNPINDYYIYSGPGYQRTHKDAEVRYVQHKKEPKREVVYLTYSEPEVKKVRYIKDERTYEYNEGRQLSIKLVGNDYGYQEITHTPSCRVVQNTHQEPHGHFCGGEVIRLSGNSQNSIYHDSDPYHYVSDHDHNIKTWNLKAEKSCVDGFNCASGDWY